ncbi:hypothetical protein [Candidatus Filomicrobium marinum]|uniref:hypothetical protein n=1 Tax=Candidatus Filomicrobium marinum TaxID=1608628 RepID=UPI001FCD82EF|nr:hypothetical protein [Candidatus Filomicrobium marinum]
MARGNSGHLQAQNEHSGFRRIAVHHHSLRAFWEGRIVLEFHVGRNQFFCGVRSVLGVGWTCECDQNGCD